MDMGGSGILFGMLEGDAPRCEDSVGGGVITAAGPVMISGGGEKVSWFRFKGGGRPGGLKEYRLGECEVPGISKGN
jgi:hypothetical protein